MFKIHDFSTVLKKLLIKDKSKKCSSQDFERDLRRGTFERLFFLKFFHETFSKRCCISGKNPIFLNDSAFRKMK